MRRWRRCAFLRDRWPGARRHGVWGEIDGRVLGDMQLGVLVRGNPAQARCKVHGRGSGVVRCRPGVRFKEGSGGSGMVRRRPGVRFKEGSGALVQVRCKVKN